MLYNRSRQSGGSGKKARVVWDKSLWLFFIFAALSGQIIRIMIYMAAVILHELAHVISARGFGFRLLEIRILPVGGAALLEDALEEEPFAQALVALSGPVHNFVLVFLLWFIQKRGIVLNPYMQTFYKANIALGLVNLLPVIPLDGGKVLHMVLAVKMGWLKGKKWAIRMGRMTLALVAVFFILGILNGFWHVTWFIWLLFLWWALEQEKLNQFFQYWRMITAKKEQLRRKGILPVVSFAVRREEKLANVCRRLPQNKYHLLILLDKKAETVEEAITESEAVSLILAGGYHLTMAEAVRIKTRRKKACPANGRIDGTGCRKGQ